jgi:hypothetical protein
MRKIILGVALSAVLALPLLAQAADDDMSSTTVASSSDVTHGYLRNEVVGIKPEVGTIVFNDPSTGVVDSRAAVGLDASWNVAGSFLPSSQRNFFIGPNTGVLFSHLGYGTSNFFGTNNQIQAGDPGANIVLIPADLKVGYTFGDNFRLSAHGGGNVLYRSVASSLYLGDSSSVPGSVWRLFPNAGADLEFGMGSQIAVLIRPDVTFTPGNALFAGTIGLGVSLG